MAQTTKPYLMPLEEAVACVLDQVHTLPIETVDLLDAVGRVAADDLKSDIDVSSFDHAAMDGFALHSERLSAASADAPVELRVVADIGAGTWFDTEIGENECVRIMTGAAIPPGLDAVVKVEVVSVVEGDGKTGSTVSFDKPTKVGSNIRQAGEEAKAGDVVIHAGEVISDAGIGMLAGCGVLQVPTYARPRVTIIATGSELVEPSQVPPQGKIRNSNSLAMAASVREAGGIPTVTPVVEDTFEALESAILEAIPHVDFIITTGGAANGDYDFIKPVAEKLGQVFVTTVNMRPGKAQTFALVEGVPVFGLPGNPAAAYCGFQMIIRPALRAMQGYSSLERPQVQARLADDFTKKDSRRIYLRGVLSKDDQGYVVQTASNQSSGLFGVIQRSNCLVVLPEGAYTMNAGDMVSCILLNVAEEVVV